MLISLAGLPPAIAVGTDLLFAAITKASAAWRHQKLGNVDWNIFGRLAFGSLPAALAVIAWNYAAAPDTRTLAHVIRQGLAIALFMSAAASALYPLLAKRGQHARQREVSGISTGRRAATYAFGGILGFFVALTSVGAGAIGVTVLMGLYPLLSARRLIGTDIMHAVPLTLIAGLGHLGMGHVDFRVLALLLLGSLPGIAIGSRMTGIAPDWLLRIVLSIVLLNAGLLLL
jgi:uncharacterized membrane protein YfcA